MPRATGPGRITKDDIRAAGLRRWDGRGRITADWINLYHEPELCFANGDCFVYLREPGQSIRGPSFRVHVSQLVVKGFKRLVDRCTQQVQMTHLSPECLTNGCQGCGKPSTMRALYLPAPRDAGLDAVIDHHLSVRNFFAWMYNVQLAGRTLGKSLVELKGFLDLYRPGQEDQNRDDVVAFADFQRYLDFRECVDHALAALYFAEKTQIEDLWIDGFAHCVGLSHKGIRNSIEYSVISPASKAMISKASLEVDIRADRVSRSVANFFENDLSAAFLGLHQAARDHLDRFRSFLQSFYIEQHGFWPPQDFENEEVMKALYIELYSDFRNLYHHLVDPESTSSMVDNVSHSGGVCTLQNIQAFDARHGYDALPHPLPMIPQCISPDALAAASRANKSGSLNPLKKRRAERDARDQLSLQALIECSNRDWLVMNNLLVRRYAEFERLSVFDDFDHVSLVDGRKVRWILVYAVLQTLITVMQAPKQVRNTEGLSYSLCCHIPQTMPWNIRLGSIGSYDTTSLTSSDKDKMELTPDINYSHTNSSNSSLSQTSSKRERRKSLPARSPNPVGSRPSAPSRSTSRSASLRRFFVKRTDNAEEHPLPKRPAFCEIFVQGYGNGLNDSQHDSSARTMPNRSTERPLTPPTPTTLVSRESSTTSSHSARSSGTNPSGDDMPDMDHLSVIGDHPPQSPRGGMTGQRFDETDQLKEVHFNAKTWDAFLES